MAIKPNPLEFSFALTLVECELAGQPPTPDNAVGRLILAKAATMSIPDERPPQYLVPGRRHTIPGLTPMRRGLLDVHAGGETVVAYAERLGLSERTLQTRDTRLRRALRANSHPHAMRLAKEANVPIRPTLRHAQRLLRPNTSFPALSLISRGWTAISLENEYGETFELSADNIRTRIMRAHRGLGAKTAAQAVYVAMLSGLMQPDYMLYDQAVERVRELQAQK